VSIKYKTGWEDERKGEKRRGVRMNEETKKVR
jgi:hypothetical protein